MKTHPREAQMSLAEAHAGEDWNDRFDEFVRSWRQGEFTGEEMRQHAAAMIGEPATCRAWGSAISRLARQGVIERVADKVATRWNGNLAPVWRLK